MTSELRLTITLHILLVLHPGSIVVLHVVRTLPESLAGESRGLDVISLLINWRREQAPTEGGKHG